MACESQTTFGAFKVTTTEKMTVVEMHDQSILVAECGYAAFSSRAVCILKERVRKLKPTRESSVAEEAMRAVHDTVKEHLGGMGKSLEEAKDYLLMNAGFELLIAYYFNSKACLYKVTGWGGVPELCKYTHLTGGSGRELGDCLLDDYAKPKMDTGFAVLLSISVIKKVSRYIEGCGGQIHVGVIRHSPVYSFDSMENPLILPKETIQDYQQKVEKAEQESDDARRSNFQIALMKVYSESTQKFLDSFGNQLLSDAPPPNVSS